MDIFKNENFFNDKSKSASDAPAKNGNLPDKLSVTEAEILKKYFAPETIDNSLLEEIDQLKAEVEKVQKSYPPENKAPFKSEIEELLKSPVAEQKSENLQETFQNKKSKLN